MYKIALITPVLPVPFDPSRGRFILEIARALSAMSENATVKVFLLHSEYPKAVERLQSQSFLTGRVPSGYSIDGIDLTIISYPALPVLSRALNPHVSSRLLKPHLRQFEPDVVLGYWIYPDGAAAIKAASQIGKPCILGALGSDVYVREGMAGRATRRTLARADAVTTVSNAMSKHVIDAFGCDPDKVTTIINGFDASVFHPRDQAQMRARFDIAPDKKVVMYVGRLVATKGLGELIDAFALLHQHDARAFLVLAGDGVMRDELQGKVDSYGLNDSVRFLGGVEPDVVAQYLGAADLLTLPSWSEGYPNVLVEAIACGRPVVSTRVGGVDEIINPSNGLFAPVKDANGLFESLRKVLEQDWDAEKISVAVQRSWDDVASDTLKLIDQLVS